MDSTQPRKSNVGYCRHCLTNVQHQRSVRTPLGRLLDTLTLGLGRYFGIGSWMCASCGSASLLFPPYRRDAGEYDPRRSSTRNQPTPEIERVGNYLDAEVSLVARAGRQRQYTQRFRERVVESLLAGEAQFSEIRKKLELTELDLQDWIARYHQDRLHAPESSVAGEPDVLDGTVVRAAPEDEDAPAAERKRRSVK